MVGIGRTRRAGLRTLSAACAASACAGLLAVAPRPAAAAETPDQASTRAYLQAATTLDQALVANASASDASAAAFSARIARECRGVLAKAPRGENEGSTPREQGLAARRHRQLQALRFELLADYGAAVLAPELGALSAFRQAVGPLRWSDPAVTGLAGSAGTLLSALAQPSAADVCADIRAWVASGYQRVSPAAYAAAHHLEGPLVEGLLRTFTPGHETLAGRLERYEDAPLRALAQRTGGLAASLELLPGHGLAASGKLAEAIGLNESRSESEHRRGTVIGAGLTDADGRYVLRMERSQSGLACRWLTNVEYTPTADFLPGVTFEGDESGSSSCGNLQPPIHRPLVSCTQDEARIEARTPPAVRTVRLRLADGRSVTSPVLRVPRRVGGPAGFYYEVVRGTPPRPVRLTELGAAGRVLQVVRLPRTHCGHGEPRFPAPVEIAHGTTPDGTAFELDGRFESISAKGQRGDFRLSLRGAFEEEALLGEEHENKSNAFVQDTVGPFEYTVRSRCGPPESAIAFGLLRAPDDTVLVKTAAGLTTLAKAALPAGLHMHAVAAYGAVPEQPAQVIVHAPDGKTVATRNWGKLVAEQKEFCEGYDEP